MGHVKDRTPCPCVAEGTSYHLTTQASGVRGKLDNAYTKAINKHTLHWGNLDSESCELASHSSQRSKRAVTRCNKNSVGKNQKRSIEFK